MLFFRATSVATMKKKDGVRKPFTNFTEILGQKNLSEQSISFSFSKFSAVLQAFIIKLQDVYFTK